MVRLLTLKEWLSTEGYSSVEEAISDFMESDPDLAVVPALCEECCQVEPDGHCPHGAPSLLLAAGMI